MRTKIINHLTCEVLAVLKLACADISINVIRQKAFSTCSAHLTVMIVFHGTILFTCGKPKSMDPLGEDKHNFPDKLISVSYRVLTPMLNTIIYSLRNKHMKAAVRNLVFQKPLTEFRLYCKKQLRNEDSWPGTVAHSYNPSTLGGQGRGRSPKRSGTISAHCNFRLPGSSNFLLNFAFLISLALLPTLECSGTILAHCNLCLRGSIAAGLMSGVGPTSNLSLGQSLYFSAGYSRLFTSRYTSGLPSSFPSRNRRLIATSRPGAVAQACNPSTWRGRNPSVAPNLRRWQRFSTDSLSSDILRLHSENVGWWTPGRSRHTAEPKQRARVRVTFPPPGGFGNSVRQEAGLERTAANHQRTGAPGAGPRESCGGGGSGGQAGSEHPVALDPPGPDMATVRASLRGALLLLLAVAGVVEVAGGLTPGSAGE
ncbi:Olfactory receptor 13C7 [Plecturocebus cupreus]